MQVPNHRTNREHFDSSIPAYQSNDPQRNDCEIEFQTQHHIADHCLGSPPRWTGRASRTRTNRAFPSFPTNHHHNTPSTTKQLQLIKESRNSLMRMVEDMPESSYELSLRDMVDDQRAIEEVQVQQKVDKEETDDKYGFEPKFDPNTKEQYKKKGQISRMESGVFPLKMFIPTSLSSKRDSKEKTGTKVSPKASPERAEKWNGLWRSTSDISWSTQRPFTSYFRVSSWSSNRKPRQRGCLF
ncbi:hypothetical protein LIER_08044 [Lithospermum erythrorhizon]|uniref:Uncharacterized protein n=1 Tax=Lithospermum erythrorhizon TaxID=34254 RepID=A0AAV3PC42_LITER